MTFHSLVQAYGQRRGYAMSDYQRSLLLSSSSSSQGSTSSSTDQVTIDNSSSSPVVIVDLTSNLTEPTSYWNELQLFASYLNSLPIAVRRRFRSFADGAVGYFVQKLSPYGHSPDVFSTAVEDIEFGEPPNDADPIDEAYTTALNDRFGSVDQLVRKFLEDFRTPLLREYFFTQTSIFDSSKSEITVRGEAADGMDEKEENIESEKEDDDVEDPSWWKKVERVESIDVESDSNEFIRPKSDTRKYVDEIRQLWSKIAEKQTKGDVENEWPSSIKVYNFSSRLPPGGRGARSQQMAAVCADITSDGRFACYGCDDSSIRCFPIRRQGAIADSPAIVLRPSTASGITYRIGAFGNPTANGGTSLLLSTSDDSCRPVQLFDLATSEKIYDYRGHQWPVWALDTSERGGGMFLTGSYDRTARFFLLERKDPIRVLAGHESSVDCVKFVRDQTTGGDNGYPPLIATASSDGTVRVWSLNDAIALRVFHGMKGWPTAMTNRPNIDGAPEKLLACATTEGKIFVWDIESGRTYQILEHVLANDLQFTSDGRYLVAGGEYGCFKMYRLSIGGGGEFGSQYVEMPINPENLLLHNTEAKFLKIKFFDENIICLTA